MSVDQFYSIVTGVEDAFYQMCMVLPSVIDIVVKNDAQNKVPHDSVAEELYAIVANTGAKNDELAMAIAVYMLGFSTYTGFAPENSIESTSDANLRRVYEYAKRLSALNSKE